MSKAKARTLGGAHPCTACRSECCRYITVPIAAPRDLDDCDTIRWYLHHRGTSVYVTAEGEWRIHAQAGCRNLDRAGRCRIYAARPDVCRDYDHGSCESADAGEENLAEFSRAAEFDRYVAQRYRVVGRALRRRRAAPRPRR